MVLVFTNTCNTPRQAVFVWYACSRRNAYLQGSEELQGLVNPLTVLIILSIVSDMVLGSF